MDFSRALELVKNGARVTRDGWNGRDMWLVLVPASDIIVSAGRPLGEAAPELIGKKVRYQAHIDMRTAQGTIVPWLASQSDLLAEDWREV